LDSGHQVFLIKIFLKNKILKTRIAGGAQEGSNKVFTMGISPASMFSDGPASNTAGIP